KTEWVGHKIDDSIDVVKKSTEKAVDSVGEATKSISNHLNPMKWSW
ncbi:hypothetical protein, partial [Staphylococcus aureus]